MYQHPDLQLHTIKQAQQEHRAKAQHHHLVRSLRAGSAADASHGDQSAAWTPRRRPAAPPARRLRLWLTGLRSAASGI